jgi:uncharacterized protein (DUF302 family)
MLAHPKEVADEIARAAARTGSKGGITDQMTTKQITVQRFSVTSSKPLQAVVARLEALIGHPDMSAIWRDVASAKTYPEVEQMINKVIGTSGLMEFTRYDHGQFLRKAHGAGAPGVLRLVVGNPLIMKQMVEHVPDAGSYAPVTILIDERPDGVHLSYDTMSSFLSSYGSPQAMKVAQDLDSKVEALLTAAAS